MNRNLQKTRLSSLGVAKTLWPVALGAAIGLAWFLYNLSLPIAWQGLTCCDAGEYYGLAVRQDVYSITTQRTFGYPAFLHQFYLIYTLLDNYTPYAWIPAAAWAQMVIWMISVKLYSVSLESTARGIRGQF